MICSDEILVIIPQNWPIVAPDENVTFLVNSEHIPGVVDEIKH